MGGCTFHTYHPFWAWRQESFQACEHQERSRTWFNLSLAQSVIPTCFKKSTILPVLKKTRPACLNDYRPVALTSVVIKCFEQLVKDCSSLPSTLDPPQFAYCTNWSTEDAIAHILHTSLSHLDKSGNYVRLLFIDYSSVPSRLITKLKDLELNTSLWKWVLGFLTGRPQDGRTHLIHPHP